MLELGELTTLSQQALLLSVAVALPVVGAAALIGLLVSVVQAATQVQDHTIGHLPRLLVVVAVLAASGPWMGAQIAEFAVRAFGGG
jgi:type III secretion HrpO family protein